MLTEQWAEEGGESEGRSVMGRIGVAPPGNMTPHESEQTSAWSFMTRESGKPPQEAKQMTATTAPTGEALAGAASRESVDWQAIDWHQAHRNVRRLQARIVKATQEGRWSKVKALQHLLTHSFSGKALAVRRVTENQGKRTPGVDGISLRDTRTESNGHHALEAAKLPAPTSQACVHTECDTRSS
jgi:hypothetical protein